MGVVFDDREMGGVAGLGEFGLGWLGGDAVCGFGGRVLIVAAGDDEHMGNTDLLDEGGVMADHDDCAGVIFEVFADDFLGVGVEVVGRLVEDDEVRALEEDFAEGDAGFFAGGEDADFFVDIVAIEEEVREGGAEFGVGEVVACDVFEDGAAFVEDFEFLGVVGDGRVFAEDDGAGERLELADNEFQKGRLSDAVFADDEELFAAVEVEGEVVVEEWVSTVGESEVLDFERSAAGEFRGGDVEGDFGVFSFPGLKGFEFLREDFFALVAHSD